MSTSRPARMRFSLGRVALSLLVWSLALVALLLMLVLVLAVVFAFAYALGGDDSHSWIYGLWAPIMVAVCVWFSVCCYGIGRATSALERRFHLDAGPWYVAPAIAGALAMGLFSRTAYARPEPFGFVVVALACVLLGASPVEFKRLRRGRRSDASHESGRASS